MDNIASYIILSEFEGWLLILKIVFLILALISLIGISLFLFKSSWFKRILLWDLAEILTYRPFGVRKMVRAWAKIMARLEIGTEAEYKLAVIEADLMLEDILKRMGYAGTTLGERLEKLTAATLPNIEQVWEAHKTRNSIVHDPDYRLSLDQTRKTLAIYEQALKDLQAF
jgi:hypothetical protein